MARTRKRVAKSSGARGHLRISEVAKIVGISPSILRAWENLGLVSPSRTQSRYRLYSPLDVRVLKRAQFLRRARGMNAPAIVHLLKTQGMLSAAASKPKAKSIGPRLRRLRTQR